MLRKEMSSQAKPSLDGMAEQVIAKGRFARRVRTAKIASAVFVVIGLAVAVPTIARGHAAAPAAAAKIASQNQRPTKSDTRPAHAAGSSASGATSGSATTLTTALPGQYIPQPAGPKEQTTPAAVLDELLKLLPPGATSDYAFYKDQYQIGAQANLDGALGLGMIRVFVYPNSLPPCTGSSAPNFRQVCGTLPDGASVVTTKIPGNCIQSLAIDVDHGGGTVVEIDVATCLAWNGQANPSADMAITAAQALQIAANPAWGSQHMSADIVRQGARRFADVPIAG